MGIQNMGACIGVPEVEDEYLTCDSVHFHEHLGFRMVGEFYKCGFKFGRWYNMAWMEKHIGEHGAQPKGKCKCLAEGESRNWSSY